MTVQRISRLGYATILIGVVLAIVGALPVLSPQQDGSTPPDLSILALGAALAGAGVVVVLGAILWRGIFYQDEL